MERHHLICGLDIGSRSVRCVAGSYQEEDLFYVLGAYESPAEGIHKGMISSLEEAVSSISDCLEGTERIVGAPVKSAYVGISGSHIVSTASKGVVAVSQVHGEIRDTDVERVIDAAQAVATPANYEIIHVIPRVFRVDQQEGIRDPIGMTGVRLEVEANIIQAQSTHVKNITKAILRTGIDIDDVVLGILACAESTLTKRQKELGVALVNIGANTTSLIVFEEGDLVTTAALPIGSAHITNDIAIGLRTSIDTAEEMKLEYGTATPKAIGKRDELDLADISSVDEGKVSLKHVSEIIEARLEEIFALVEKELVKAGKAGLLPSGIVLTGGGAKLEGVVEVAKRSFRLPASLGRPVITTTTAIEKVNSLDFTTALGLALWGSRIRGAGARSRSLIDPAAWKHIPERVVAWAKNLIR